MTWIIIDNFILFFLTYNRLDSDRKNGNCSHLLSTSSYITHSSHFIISPQRSQRQLKPNTIQCTKRSYHFLSVYRKKKTETGFYFTPYALVFLLERSGFFVSHAKIFFKEGNINSHFTLTLTTAVISRQEEITKRTRNLKGIN